MIEYSSEQVLQSDKTVVRCSQTKFYERYQIMKQCNWYLTYLEHLIL